MIHLFRLLAFVSLASLTSCFEYEEELSAVTYDDDEFLLSGVLMEDWGTHSANHYNMDFSLIGEDAAFEYNENALGEPYYTLSEPYDCYIFTEFFSPGKKNFTPGVFQELGDRHIEQIDQDEFVFRRLRFGRSENEGILGEKGTVTISIDKNGTYRFKFDVELTTGKKLKGSFTGVPQYLKRQ